MDNFSDDLADMFCKIEQDWLSLKKQWTTDTFRSFIFEVQEFDLQVRDDFVLEILQKLVKTILESSHPFTQEDITKINPLIGKLTAIFGSDKKNFDAGASTIIVQNIAPSPNVVRETTKKLSDLLQKLSKKPQNTPIIDVILQNLFTSLGLLTKEQIIHLVNKQKQLKSQGIFVSFKQMLESYSYMDQQVIDNLYSLKNPNGKSFVENCQIKSVLGEGGMAGVYYGKEMQPPGREVAVKVFIPSNDAEKANSELQRFDQESKLMGCWNHARITQSYDSGQIFDMPYMIMEYVKGVTLEQKIKQSGPYSEQEALAIFEKTLDGLFFAWQQGVIHRDIKPGNIMITPDNEIKICDFGLAKVWNANASLTQKGTILGTPYFMSPEQCSSKSLDYRTDVYSLGATLFTMLTGYPLFQGNDYLEILQQHRFEPPPPVSQFSISISSPLQQFLYKLLAKEPEKRCLCSTTLWQDLYNVQNGKPLQENEQQEVSKIPSAKKRKLPIIVISLLLFAIVSIGAVKIYRARQQIGIFFTKKQKIQIANAWVSNSLASNNTEQYVFDKGHRLFLHMDLIINHYSPEEVIVEYNGNDIKQYSETLVDLPQNGNYSWAAPVVFTEKKKGDYIIDLKLITKNRHYSVKILFALK